MMNFIKRQLKRVLYRIYFEKKDVEEARQINDPERVASALGPDVQDIFWKHFDRRNSGRR